MSEFDLYLCCRTPRGQPCSYRDWLGAASRWGYTLAGKRPGPGGPDGYRLQWEGTQSKLSTQSKRLLCDEQMQPCLPALCVGLSPSSPLGRKPPLAQSSMGLTWSSGLSDSQGGNVFSARVLAIWAGQRRHWIRILSACHHLIFNNYKGHKPAEAKWQKCHSL